MASESTGELIKRLEALATARSRRDGADRGRTGAALLAVVWRVVRDAADFWDDLDAKERQRLRAFFAETKGDPRRIAKADPRERAEAVRLLGEGIRRSISSAGR
jgi:hypothetical protein